MHLRPNKERTERKDRKRCQHGKDPWDCIQCGNHSTCQHGRRRRQCVLCVGKGICEHHRRRIYCVQCKGDYTCDHQQRFSSCRICGPQKFPYLFCKICKFTQVRGKKYEGHCHACYARAFPDRKMPRRQRVKEIIVGNAIREYFPQLEWRLNQTVRDGCSLYRPDLFVDLYTHSLIVEIDEHQHRNASYTCEEKRIMCLFEDLGSRPLIVVRFNPDAYDEKNGPGLPVLHRYRSCFTNNKDLVLKEWQRRFDVLQKEIHSALVPDIPKRELTVTYLFYSSTSAAIAPAMPVTS